ncbi:hypothetical protein, partial [Pseudomonas sp. PA-3-11C]
MSSAASFRTEKDLLGVLEVPAQAYYGIPVSYTTS